MDDHTEPVCVQTSFKGELRIRLCCFAYRDGEQRYSVEVMAWNAWARQAKLISLVGGLEAKPAHGLFENLERDLRGYDWVSGECLFESVQ